MVTKKPGKLAKLFGASPSLDQDKLPADLAPMPGSEQQNSQQDDAESSAEATEPEQPQLVEQGRETAQWNDSDEEQEPAVGFDGIQAKISFIIDELTQSAEADEQVRQQLETAKTQLENGLNWYEMIAVLEHVRNLFVSVQQTTSEQFADYLKEVDATLLAIKQNWDTVIGGQQAQSEGQVEIKRQLQQRQAGLTHDLNKNTDLDALKQSVNSHVKELNSTISLVSSLEQHTITTGQAMQSMQAQLAELQAKNEQLHQELENQRHQATHDALTQLPNRVAYNQRAAQELARWQRYQRPLSVAVLDVDHFKRFNDTYGHQAGDRVLKIIAEQLRENLRTVDFVARFGGEEFVILLPETSSDDAVVALDKLRQELSNARYKFKDEPVTITASFGVTQYREDDSVDSAFERADEALYKAKQGGRNKVFAL